jgi:hypothetical protein
MSFYNRAVNTTESANRIRFESLSERLRKINVDLIHRVDRSIPIEDNHIQSYQPKVVKSLFEEELENLKNLDVTSHFSR